MNQMRRQILYIASAFTAIAIANPVTQPPSPSETCQSSACAEFINTCSQTFGGCYLACPGYTIPTFPDPGCPTPSFELRKPGTTSSACSNTNCIDYINACGIRYGGCFPACTGYTTPSFTVPACPTPVSTETPTATVTTTASHRKPRLVVTAFV